MRTSLMVFLAVLFIVAYPVAAADLASPGSVTAAAPGGTVSGTVTFISSDGSVDPGNLGIDLTIASGGLMKVGDTGNTQNLNWNLGSNIVLTDATSELSVVGNNNYAISATLTLNTLDMTNGGVVSVEGGQSSPNTLNVANLLGGQGTLALAGFFSQSVVNVANAATLGTGGAFTIDFTFGATAGTTFVNFNGGLTANNVVLTSSSGATGTVTAASLSVAANGSFTGVDDIDLTVAGATTVGVGGTLSVADAVNTFGGGVTLAGMLTSLSDATVNVTGGVGVGSAGEIRADTHNLTVVSTAAVTVDSGGVLSALNGATLTLGDVVTSGNVAVDGTSALVTGAYTMNGGRTDIGLNGTGTTFNGAVAINAGTFTSYGASTDFGGNLTVGGGASAARLGGSGILNFTGGTPVVTVTSKGVLFTDTADLSIAGAAVTFNAGSTLSVNDNNAGTVYKLVTTGSNAITFDTGSKILIASGDSINTQTTVASSGSALLYTGGGEADFLAAQNTGGSAASSYVFTADSNNIYVQGGALDRGSAQSYNNSIASMAGLGVVSPESMVPGSFGDALYDFSANTAQSDGSHQGDLTKDIMDRFAGNAGYPFHSSREADAAANVMSGKMDVLTMTPILDTQRMAFGNIAKELSFGNTRELAVGQAAYASDSGLASVAYNCGSSINRAWLGGFGTWEDADRRNGDAGYKYKSGGFMLGYDRTFGQALTVGAAFGYSRGDFEAKAALDNDSDIDTYSFNLYANYRHHSGFFATAMGGYAYSDNDIRTMYTVADWDKSDYHVGTWAVGGTLGYEWRPLPCLAVTPSAGLYYYDARSNRYNSTVKNGLKLKQDSTELPVELTVAYDVINAGDKKLSLEGSVGWSYAFDDNGADADFRYNNIVNSPTVYVEGRKPGRHTLSAGGGVRYRTGRFEFAAEYDYRRRADFDSHRVFGSVGIRF